MNKILSKKATKFQQNTWKLIPEVISVTQTKVWHIPPEMFKREREKTDLIVVIEQA